VALVGRPVALLLGGLAGYRSATLPPAVDSVDVGFARDMSVHHEQAVQMVVLAYDRSDDSAALAGFRHLIHAAGQPACWRLARCLGRAVDDKLAAYMWMVCPPKG
jgi:hypothetical protein